MKGTASLADHILMKSFRLWALSRSNLYQQQSHQRSRRTRYLFDYVSRRTVAHIYDGTLHSHIVQARNIWQSHVTQQRTHQQRFGMGIHTKTRAHLVGHKVATLLAKRYPSCESMFASSGP